MSESEKKTFINGVTVLVDTREQKNAHITEYFRQYGIKFERVKLDYGDYSFRFKDKDFSRSCVVERKANTDELYGNAVHDRQRIEKELDIISRNAAHCTFLVENCGSWEELKAVSLAPWDMEGTKRQVKNIGVICYGTLRSWCCGNRYGFAVEFVKETSDSARKILEALFWYWHNYKRAAAPRR